MANATIYEQGNGFPSEGAHVGDGACLWRVERIEGPIHTGSPRGNYVHAEVTEVSWDDCPEEDVFPARIETSIEDSND